jgi:ferrous iron transport protein B
MFNLFTPPCFAALGAMNSEIGNRKWFWSGVALQLATGYTLAFVVYQVGTMLTEGTWGTGFLPGLMTVGCIAGTVVYLCRRADQKASVK